MTQVRNAIAAGSLVLALVTVAWAGGAATGRFLSDPVARWEPDGRTMTLIESFEYIDANERSWHVPSGVRVDGASIPPLFWSLIGGPFDGQYRNASIIHDYYCDNRQRRWEDVHRVFYEAMLTSGVSKSKASLMYKAVERFGPRWDEPQVDPKCLRPDGSFNFDACTENSDPTPSPAQMPRLAKDDLMHFADDMQGSADPADLAKLRELAETID